MAEARNNKFGVQIDHQEYYRKNAKLGILKMYLHIHPYIRIKIPVDKSQREYMQLK